MDRTPALDSVRQTRNALLAALDEFERGTCPHATGRFLLPAETVRALFEQVALRFADHAKAKESLLAPLFLQSLAASQEKEELAAMLAAFRETLDRPAHRERDEQLRVQAGDLVALLRSQLRKEETLVFAIAARAKSSPRRHKPRGDRP